jgi:AcrR family transcriptional regulator
MATSRAKAEAPTSKPATRRRRARGSLSREEIIEAARQIIETDGLRELSMPALAQSLQSGVTSIYWYFRNKDELLDALAHHIFHDLHEQLPPLGDGPWQTELIQYFVALRDLLRRQVAYREIVAYASSKVVRSVLTSTAARRLDDGLALLEHGAGLPRSQALDVYGVCLNYTRGFVVLEEAETTPDQTDPPRRGTPAHTPEDQELAQLTRLDDHQFTLGLHLITAGILHQGE